MAYKLYHISVGFSSQIRIQIPYQAGDEHANHLPVPRTLIRREDPGDLLNHSSECHLSNATQAKQPGIWEGVEDPEEVLRMGWVQESI